MPAILITTKNRRQDMMFTLDKLKSYIGSTEVETVVFDDGSSDSTFEAVRNAYPQIKLHRNQASKGLMYCRNKMLNDTTADFAVSLDDDAHFISENPLEKMENHFDKYPECGVIAFRIFWGETLPEHTENTEKTERVRGFVGCGHAWRMTAWRDIPNYPEWFKFYGEEDFAAFELYKKDWQVHYVPEIFVQHRVDKTVRKKNKDQLLRQRRSLSRGWFLFFLFLPLRLIPRKMGYSIGMQLRKIPAGNFQMIRILPLAFIDLILALPRIISQRKSLNIRQYRLFMTIPGSKIYWNP